MMEWIVVLGIPALIAFLKVQPVLDRAWISFCGIFMGTFAALVLLPWTLAKLSMVLSPHNSYTLLIAFFGVTVIFWGVLYQLFCKLLPARKAPVFLSLPMAILPRLVSFCGGVLLLSVLLVSLSALPFMEQLPMIRGSRLRNTASRILIAAMPLESLESQNRAVALLNQYSRHLSRCNAKTIAAPAVPPAANQ